MLSLPPLSIRISAALPPFGHQEATNAAFHGSQMCHLHLFQLLGLSFHPEALKRNTRHTHTMSTCNLPL